MRKAEEGLILLSVSQGISRDVVLCEAHKQQMALGVKLRSCELSHRDGSLSIIQLSIQAREVEKSAP